MKKKEIKVKIEEEILNTAKKYNIDIEKLLSIAIMRRVNEIREIIRYKEFIRKLDEDAIINIIKRISKKVNKLNYAFKGHIIEEAKDVSISEERTLDILNSLEDKEIIYQPVKDNYRVSKKNL